MKKTLFLWLSLLFILAACNKSALGLSEVSKVPVDIKNNINEDHRLQLVNDGKDTYTTYIVYRTTGKVKTDLETQDDLVKVMLNETNLDDGELESHVYKLTLDPDHSKIEVLINGEPTPFDEITGGL